MRVPQHGAGPNVDIYDLVTVSINKGNIRDVYRMAEGLKGVHYIFRSVVLDNDRRGD